MALQVEYPVFNTIINELKKEYKIYAPMRVKGTGKPSDSDSIRYGEVEDINEVVYNKKSAFAAKEVFFPITRTVLYRFNNQEFTPETNEQKYIIFMRPCDINSISVFDSLFIKSKPNDNFQYKNIRDKIKIFLIECKDGFDSCFCVSMNMNKTDNYDLAIRFGDNGLLCEIKTEEFKSYFQNKGGYVSFTPEFVMNDNTQIKVPDIDIISSIMPDTSDWSAFVKNIPELIEISNKCIGCGRCNFVCPTCVCQRIHDIDYENQAGAFERRYNWAGCQTTGYSEKSGWHNYFRSNGDRMLFKVFHKIYYFKKKYKFTMCSGCGRCDDICPEYISYSNAINTISKKYL